MDMMRDVWCVLGLVFDDTRLKASTTLLNLYIEQNKRCFLTTPNLNFVIATQTDSTFFDSVIDSDLSVADGMPIIWVAKLLGVPLNERIAGSTLFDELSQQKKTTQKTKVFFFGGQQGIAEQACAKLTENSNGMVGCGFYDPGFVSVEQMSSNDVIDKLNQAEPDFIVVALGAKKGQQWIQHNKAKLKAPVISHLGAVINFVAGNIERAPLVWQRCGMEWLWRIRQEPALWKRYLYDGCSFVQLLISKVIPLAIYDRFLKRTKDYRSQPMLAIHHQTSCLLMNLQGSIHNRAMTFVKEQFSEVLGNNDENVVIDCSGLTYIDAAFLGSLLLFQRYLSESKRTLTLQAVPKRIIRIISLNNVLNRFTIIS